MWAPLYVPLKIGQDKCILLGLWAQNSIGIDGVNFVLSSRQQWRRLSLLCKPCSATPAAGRRPQPASRLLPLPTASSKERGREEREGIKSTGTLTNLKARFFGPALKLSRSSRPRVFASTARPNTDGLIEAIGSHKLSRVNLC
uniref:Uncharacterized protein n=1 Tax=Oryza sativa subsp. japonica TaxID=39947 RepID=Q654T7_ORYSJ|nr:hypothetical protein [Oryza sativa Japonica Group]